MSLVDKDILVLGTELSASDSAIILKALPGAREDIAYVVCDKEGSEILCITNDDKDLALNKEDAESLYQLTVKHGVELIKNPDVDPLDPDAPITEPEVFGLKLDETIKDSESEGYFLDGIYCEESKCTFGSFESKPGDLTKDDGATSEGDISAPNPTSSAPTKRKTTSSDSSKCN
ncbi:MAG: hypothetical protein EOO20_13555, partial [Chryseobacterium sp.]